MERRDFIRIIGTTGSILTLPYILGACTHTNNNNNVRSLNRTTDMRLRLISYAIHAPNAHNKQPWLIRLQDNKRFQLYVDQERLLPETDPEARQIHISQGTFIEHLDIAAKQFGYLLEINYFPQGMYANDDIKSKPVAGFRLHRDHSIKPDPLFAYCVMRHSNKRIYDDSDIESTILDELSTLPLMGDSQLQLSNRHDVLYTLPKLLTRAMAVEVSDHHRHMETVKMFRFNDAEINRFRDGFGIAQTGKSGISKWLIESLFISREDASRPGSAFIQQSIDLTQQQASSARAFGWLTTQGNDRLSQVLAGRNYARLNLRNHAMGLAIHPLSQILEEYKDMSDLKQEFYTYLKIPKKHTVQMLFRLGYAKFVPQTPRRDINNLLI